MDVVCRGHKFAPTKRWPVDYLVVACQATSTVDSVAAFRSRHFTMGAFSVKSSAARIVLMCHRRSAVYSHPDVTTRKINHHGVPCQKRSYAEIQEHFHVGDMVNVFYGHGCSTVKSSASMAATKV
ncbi:hypothetical protein TELCIR_15264 [Teladorsagia circumcincta]|uniref:Uncharacterized protein n=1 Tax=Teladorsagia circumcincta TaxID=45464 RepID=A0A2G9U0X9_TELCI|nr:hypothetical protein TELCIR_15264 [Teladorsagia circumcincta]